MEFNKKTPREQLGIQGAILTIPIPFNEGHVCTANEASALNQLLKENVRNNQAPHVKKMLKENKTPEEMQAHLDKYMTEYTIGVRRSGGTKDPIRAEAISLAKEKVKKAILDKGGKLNQFKAADITAKAEMVVDQYPQFMEKAAEIVGRRTMDFADLEIDTSQAPAEA